MKKIQALLLAALGAAACNNTMNEPALTGPSNDNVNIWGADVNDEDRVLGEATIHVTEEFADELEKNTGEDGWVQIEQTKATASCIIRMRRTFPDGGEFEPRQREAGLHQWYEIQYSENLSTTKAVGSLSGIEGVDQIEFKVRTTPLEISEDVVYIDANKAAPRTSATSDIFDDPQLGRQWHYYNNGSTASSVSGCDINVLPVWSRYTTGSDNVIIGVVDQGVDYNHEDLADNMWHNPSQSGKSVYGRNFVNGNFTINPGNHGTHVAGTIAAVNNNGIGVCGIAGGDAKLKKGGVKIMSCQIFDGNKEGSGAEAIVWSCNNGAVISQNSWGYTTPMEIPGSLKNAITYFINNAGKDSQGNQTGPIEGGVVVFAAGNENSIKPYGTNSPDAIVVSSVGADYRRAYYSNYGDWVHIAAPGGDANKGNQVLSTFINNKYGYYQGTSMACPHVSGVVALLVSRLQGKGVTGRQIREKVLGNTTSISSFNPNYYLGKGLVNCYMAMAGSGGKAPDMPTGLQATSIANNVDIKVTVPKDDDDTTPSSIIVYYSKNDFTSPEGQEFALFYVGSLKVGATLEGTIPGLDFNTKYYLAAQAKDLAGNVSKMTDRITVETGSNIIPRLSPRNQSIEFKGHENPNLQYTITNQARHFYYIDLKRESAEDSVGVFLDTTIREKPVIRFTGKDLRKEGLHKATLKVTDIYGDSDQVLINFTILENHKPYIVKSFEDMLFASRIADPIKFKADDYFKDDDGETLEYTIERDGGSCNFTFSKDKGEFTLTPMEYGYTTIRVTGTDIRGESVTQTFRTLVRNSKNAVDVYPNPVHDNLYFRTSGTSEGGDKIMIKVQSPSGQTYFEGEKTVTAFEPFVLNMLPANPGVYCVAVKFKGQTYKFNIAKI